MFSSGQDTNMSAAYSPDLTLYGYFRSSATWRVRIALALKNIPYKKVIVSVIEGQQKKQEYTKLNAVAAVKTTFCTFPLLCSQLPFMMRRPSHAHCGDSMELNTLSTVCSCLFRFPHYNYQMGERSGNRNIQICRSYSSYGYS